jgi:predicted nuclease of predicted toxin-antitoxin system
VKFIVHAQLPPGLARLLRESGCDAFAVREIGLREANDGEIWRYVVQQQAAIITKDEDFAGALLVQPRPGSDRLVANWQHVESGAVKMVCAAVARDHAVHRVG